MRLAFIGDEMEVRWMLPRVGELPGMAMYRWCPPSPPPPAPPLPLGHRLSTTQCLSLPLHQAKTVLFRKGLDLKCW